MADQFQPPTTSGMVQCEVTGKWVPLAETVVFQGKRVSLEGKERLIELLKSGELLPGELEKPTVLRRFSCMFVDGIILGMINGAFGMIGGIGLFAAGDSLGQLGNLFMFQALSTFVSVSVYIAYFGILHGLKGQSLGKMAGKLRVVNRDGSPVDMKTAFLRAFYFAGINYISAVGFIVAAASDETITAPTITIVLQMIVGVYGLVNAVLALLDKAEQRALHDRLAGTRVIMDV